MHAWLSPHSGLPPCCVDGCRLECCVDGCRAQDPNVGPGPASELQGEAWAGARSCQLRGNQPVRCEVGQGGGVRRERGCTCPAVPSAGCLGKTRHWQPSALVTGTEPLWREERQVRAGRARGARLKGLLLLVPPGCARAMIPKCSEPGSGSWHAPAQRSGAAVITAWSQQGLGRVGH